MSDLEVVQPSCVLPTILHSINYIMIDLARTSLMFSVSHAKSLREALSTVN